MKTITQPFLSDYSERFVAFTQPDRYPNADYNVALLKVEVNKPYDSGVEVFMDDINDAPGVLYEADYNAFQEVVYNSAQVLDGGVAILWRQGQYEVSGLEVGYHYFWIVCYIANSGSDFVLTITDGDTGYPINYFDGQEYSQIAVSSVVLYWSDNASISGRFSFQQQSDGYYLSNN